MLFFAGFFGVIAGIRGDKTMLLPAGVILLLLSYSIITEGVTIQNGWSETEVVDGNTTTITKTKSYSELTTDAYEMKYIFPLILIAGGIYFVLIGVAGKSGD